MKQDIRLGDILFEAYCTQSITTIKNPIFETPTFRDRLFNVGNVVVTMMSGDT